MFKLAAFTDEITQDFRRAVAVAQEFKLDGLEIRSVWDHPPQDIPAADVAKMKAILADTDLKVCSIASPFFKCELDSEEEIGEHHDILRRCIALGKEFDCNVIRGFTFWRREPAAELWRQPLWQRILDQFAAPISILEANDAVMAIENESSTYIGAGATLARFLEALDSPRVRATWDPANSFHDSEDLETPFPDGYRAILPYTVHVHVKDCRRNEKGEFEHTAVGDGEIGWNAHFKQLKDDGYKGYASLETHWRLSKELAEGLVNRPGGRAYSESGEAASRICLENITRMVDQLRA